MAQAVEHILNEIRPSLNQHGGDALLREVRDDKVYIDLHGACQGCPMSVMTFGTVVDEMIKQRLPQIKEVVYE
ncbi:NifU family protein [Candidatus Uhrbacteria bacterium]|nr:NifU family protein [Candidatus Uhrbacteria bacterium]